MSYIAESLQKGETVLYQASVSKLAYVYALGISLVLMMPLGLTSMVSTELALTDRRLIGKTGIFSRKTLSVSHADIEVVSIRQGLLGKILDYGNVTITSKKGDRITFNAIAIPHWLQAQVEEAVEIAVLGRKLSDYVQ